MHWPKSKAFYTIDHDKMLIKLEHYCIRGTTLELLTNYLKNREQITNFKGIDSEIHKVNLEVPQLLQSWVHYYSYCPELRWPSRGSTNQPQVTQVSNINDIANSSADGDFVLFADDTNIFVSGKNEEDVLKKHNRY